MPDKAWEKLRAKIEASPKNVTEAELARLLEGVGFTEHPSGGTSHRPFRKPGLLQGVGILRQRQQPLVYVRAALKAVEEALESDQAAGAEGEGESGE